MHLLDQFSDDQIARLVFLVILAGTLGSYALVASRGRVATRLRHLVLWALLITGVAAAYGLWDSARMSMAAVQTPDGDGMVLRRSLDGQFHLTLDISGPSGQVQPISFIVDTGASEMVLTRRDAAKLGFAVGDLHFLGVASTANGVTRTAQVTLPRVVLGAHSAQRVRALVNEGELHASLLGMGYLERFARIEITREQLRIFY